MWSLGGGLVGLGSRRATPSSEESGAGEVRRAAEKVKEGKGGLRP